MCCAGDHNWLDPKRRPDSGLQTRELGLEMENASQEALILLAAERSGKEWTRPCGPR